MMPWSIISSAAGMMPAPIISLIVLVASSTESNTASSVRTALRIARQPHPNFRHHGQRAFAADQDAD